VSQNLEEFGDNAPDCEFCLSVEIGCMVRALRRLHTDGPYAVELPWGDTAARFHTFDGLFAYVSTHVIGDARIINYDRADGGGGDDGQGWNNGITEAEMDRLYEAGLA
jgi:hypothetical protein